MNIMMPLMDYAGDGGTGEAVVSSSVEVYDEKGKVVGVDTLKKNDLLVVYWKSTRSFNESITQNIQGTLYHSSLVVFYCLDIRNEGFCGENFLLTSGYISLYWWRDIDKIHFAGNDSTGRTMSFVRELNCQKVLAENTANTMRKNIDALKA